jgi:hypothetical protein
VICELNLPDARAVARIVNLAHRFACRCTRISADTDTRGTKASMSFDGPPAALARLRAQIERIVAYEAFAS